MTFLQSANFIHVIGHCDMVNFCKFFSWIQVRRTQHFPKDKTPVAVSIKRPVVLVVKNTKGEQ